MENKAFLLFVLLIFFLGRDYCQTISLPQYNVNINDTSTSGLSSGGYMSVQFQVAFSSIMKGAGIIAGGPYNCAQGKLNTATTTCMNPLLNKPNVSQYVSTTKSRSNSGSIDDYNYLTDQKVYLFSGTLDTTVHPPVMDALNQYYENFIDSSNIVYINDMPAAHTFPTTDENENKCSQSFTPYISYCNYDAAGELLQHIYDNKLNRPSTTEYTGKVYEFDQSEFLSNPTSQSLSKTGYVYVPKNCDNQAQCILHVAFHGCSQNYQAIKDQYILNTGYLPWADANNLIILFPQTVNSISLGNFAGCWDWWGYTNSQYDVKSGYQMDAVYQMVKRATSGYISIGAPTNLQVVNVTETSVSLSWDSVSQATGYNVYRGGVLVNQQPTTSTNYIDTTVQSGTTYTYYVVSLYNNGESQPSTSVTVTTEGNPPPLGEVPNFHSTDVSATSVTLSWDFLSGAQEYNIYRNNTQIEANITTNSYTDNGLTASTTYSYQVAGYSNIEGVGPLSNSVVVTTDSDFDCQVYKDSNYNQVQNGRAYTDLGYTYAKGSSENMGLYNTFVTTSLAEISQDYYIISDTCNTSN
eukprot:TRINITY_DN5640_c0_g1_i1.p1 TRINITY_DN5640_c0_g1~~TRINITY_DN5640_c0_g1_i1.p1  ORF type:complete len:579 (+),score=151.43 TRINITY_DN5640_c0_g1_i1:37-1773(+)